MSRNDSATEKEHSSLYRPIVGNDSYDKPAVGYFKKGSSSGILIHYKSKMY